MTQAPSRSAHWNLAAETKRTELEQNSAVQSEPDGTLVKMEEEFRPFKTKVFVL